MKILICDDDTLVAEVLESVLQNDGHETLVIHRGEDLLKAIAAEAFEAVVCDLSLPDIPGHLLYPKVVARFPRLADRFLFVTGGACTDDAISFIQSLSRPPVEKPFTAAMLQRAVRALIA